MRRRAEPPLRHRKARDRALALPLAGALLLTPPLGGIFEVEATVWGVPFLLVYLFAVWALLIAGTAALARRLGEAEAAGEEGEG
jgi:hypothetical protein